jgi:hypothetical protein
VLHLHLHDKTFFGDLLEQAIQIEHELGECGAASSVQRSSVILPSFPFELQPLRNAGLRQ